MLNPKSITLDELFGGYDANTREWRDGLASTLIRNFLANRTRGYKWTIFDGPVDAVWIENLNSALDDNKTLCFPNLERIMLTDEMRMLFEAENLQVARLVKKFGLFVTKNERNFQQKGIHQQTDLVELRSKSIHIKTQVTSRCFR